MHAKPNWAMTDGAANGKYGVLPVGCFLNQHAGLDRHVWRTRAGTFAKATAIGVLPVAVTAIAPKRNLPPAWPPAAGDRVSRATRRDTRANTARRCGSLGRLAPRAILRLMELAALNRVDEQGNLIPLQQLPEVDRRVIAVAANSLLD